ASRAFHLSARVNSSDREGRTQSIRAFDASSAQSHHGDLMTVAIARAVLVAAAPVTALVDAERIEALRRTQTFAVPAITLQEVSLTPYNHLRGSSGLDAYSVQIDSYAETYTGALQVAAAVRTALEAAGHLLQQQLEQSEPENNPELFQITQTWSVYS